MCVRARGLLDKVSNQADWQEPDQESSKAAAKVGDDRPPAARQGGYA
jgi:hypothetical protein